MAKSTSKGKEKSLHEKFKQFFGIKGATPLNFDHLKTEPFPLSPETLKDIGPENSLNCRLKCLKELYEIVLTKRLQDNAIEALCIKTEDMLQPQFQIETRHIVLQFYCCIVQGQLEKMNIMRSYFFKLIKNHNIAEDAYLRLDLLKALSENGKSITYFEEDIGPFLLGWFPDMIATGKASEFLPVLVNVIKCNSAYLDDDIIAGFIRYTCTLCGRSNVEDDIQTCLDVMDAVLCYSHLPSTVLQHFIFSLCITVNLEKFSQVSWKLMRNLLGTSMGHTSIFKLCVFLQDKKNHGAIPVLRGAVFFIGMALWGSKKVPSLMHPPAAVLPSFQKALDCNNNVVAYEIVLSVQRLVKKSGELLQVLTWEIILDIIERVLQYPEVQHSSQPITVLSTSIHDLITATEESNVLSCSDRLFKIIDEYSDSRDEESVIRLILHQAQFIQPIKKDFIEKMSHLLEKYFKNEKRQAVQLKVLHVLQSMRSASGYLKEDDLIDQTLYQYMSQLDLLPDVVIRKAGIELLIEIAETCNPKRFKDILEVIEKVMKRPFDILQDANSSQDSNMYCKEAFSDVVSAVGGLIRVFEKKMHMLPSSHCVGIYNILLNHIQSHYCYLTYVEDTVKIRRMILEFFLKIRSNAQKQIGMYINDKVEYSVYILCSSREASEGSSSAAISPPPGSPTVFPSQTLSYLLFGDAFQIFITCLKQEKDWRVLEVTLGELPKLLQNKALVISGNCNVNPLCASLCILVNGGTANQLNYPEQLRNTPSRFTRTDFQARVFPVVASLTAYHSELESYMQRMIIRCLQSGLVSRSAKVCIEGLTLCTLEMRNMMVKLLPFVLLKLTKISATVSVAVSILEFLSNLIRLPLLYMSFVEDQYRSIFAIALPYTNPFRFKQFTVALAHHVIAMWFLKCRIPFRKEFAKFITKGLQNNISVPFEENQGKASQSHGNDDASQKNSSGDGNRSENTAAVDKAISTLHSELMETGIDLMARFTFGMSSNVPQRSPVTDFLLEKGQKTSWMTGNKIITITTSGCGTRAFKFGFCEKCYASCRDLCKSMESDESDSVFVPTPEPVEEPPTERRRHRSAFHRRTTTLTSELQNSRLHTKDDILLHRQNLESQQHFSRRNTSYNPSNVSNSVIQGEDIAEDKDRKMSGNHLCSCWCSGWAEIHIRRPTGNTSWMMRIQNHLFLPTSPPDIPLPAITSLVLPHKEETLEDSSEYQEDKNLLLSSDGTDESGLIESECSTTQDSEGTCFYEASEAMVCPKSNVALRRTNSSPDMNTGWASFEALEQAKQKHRLESNICEESTESNSKKLCTSSSTFEDSSEFNSSSRSNDFEILEIEDPSSNVLKDKLPEPNLEKAPRASKLQHSKPSLKLDLSLSSSASDSSCSAPVHVAKEGDKGFDSSSVTNAFRDRGHTISVMSPIHPKTSDPTQVRSDIKDMHRSGMNPSFVFLQLYHNSCFGPTGEKPLLLHQTEANVRALKVLDLIQPYDTHKIGVIYVGPGQSNDELAILSNVYGSVRYVDFLRGLGNLVRLSNVIQESTYVGGLDIRGEDGKFALVWHDDVMQVIFHVATLMPNKKSDTMKTEKKKHIANDFVTIVYNDSGEDYSFSTIKGHVTSACVIIHPEDFNSNVVTIKVKTDELMDTFGHTEAYIVSDASLPIFVRQMALHANLASLILSRRQQSAEYPHVSNWLERLRTIKRLRKKVLEELKLKNLNPEIKNKSSAIIYIDDFTEYV